MLEFWHYVSLADAIGTNASMQFTAELHMIASHHHHDHHQTWALLKQTMRARSDSRHWQSSQPRPGPCMRRSWKLFASSIHIPPSWNPGKVRIFFFFSFLSSRSPLGITAIMQPEIIIHMHAWLGYARRRGAVALPAELCATTTKTKLILCCPSWRSANLASSS